MCKNSTPLWELKEVLKIFPAVKAMDRVNLKIYPGEIHALMGENGCGKSTLIKCLSGVHKPDGGFISHNGKNVTLESPIDARSHGVATIFQEFSLVPTLSVAENIFLGRLPKKHGKIDWKLMNQESSKILKELDIDIDPESIVGTLSVAQQQLIEIAKALSLDATLLIMDEPTAALGLSEIENLHRLVKKLKNQGCAIIYISHRLDEVVDLVDCVTIMKDGKVIGYCDENQVDINTIVRLMIGDDLEEHYPKERNSTQQVCFEVKNLTSENGTQNVSFDIKKGEVLGFAGLIGSGRTEIAKAIFGVDKVTCGEIVLNGKKIKSKSPEHAIKNGIGFISENRKSDGLFMQFFAQQNITIVKLKKMLKNFVLSLKKENEFGQQYVNKMKITSTCLEKSVQFLSGGNQQKVVIARWLYSEAELFIMDEPTQGIDVNAKIEVYQLINELTKNGKSVLLISSDFPELIAMSDKLAIVNDGKIEGIYEAESMNRENLMQLVLAKQSIDIQEVS